MEFNQLARRPAAIMVRAARSGRLMHGMALGLAFAGVAPPPCVFGKLRTFGENPAAGFFFGNIRSSDDGVGRLADIFVQLPLFEVQFHRRAHYDYP